MATPFPRLTPPHFASPGLATQALIRAGKTSYTAGTLCEMPAEMVVKIIGIFSQNVLGVNGNGNK
jgi:hypothetical protein